MAEIKTYARIKPTADYYDDYDCTANKLYLRIPEACSRESRIYNKTRHSILNHEFKFQKVFETESTQQDVFDTVAKNIIKEFLQGFNGTIFAYGQTGSGKTFTMEGGGKVEDDQGIAPRGISMVFSELTNMQQNDPESKITVQVSYLEIYQEVGHDLLKVIKSSAKASPSFQKVTVADGPGHAAMIRNLSMHTVTTEGGAMSFLHKGSHYRKVSETSMNDRSSRSHAVFTIHLNVKKGDILRKSKLHFVDLAGSERVCKTGVVGLQLSEAKYINLSLHYLEGVIIALHQEATVQRNASRPPTSHMSKGYRSPYVNRPITADGRRTKHIPYRNSLLTMVLKDSLGGNCLTAMIATISLEEFNLSESVSTCRFAQRVACIANAATRNEEIDDKSMIKRLRKRVAELEAQNSMLRIAPMEQSISFDGSESNNQPLLSETERDTCALIVTSFINGEIRDPVNEGITDPNKFRECMKLLKQMLMEQSSKLFTAPQERSTGAANSHYRKSQPNSRYRDAHVGAKRPSVDFRDDSNTLMRNYSYSDAKIRPPKKLMIRPYALKHKPDAPSPANIPGMQQLEQKLKDLEKRTNAVVNRKDEKRPQTTPATSAGRAYQSPYEKKQLKAATQLNKKVETKIADQMEQQHHLQTFRDSIAQQRQEIALESLRHKLENAKEQVVEQQNYLIKLHKERADRELIGVEKVVEQQLLKRQERIENQIAEVKQTKPNEEDLPEKSNPHKNSIRTLEEKFETYRKKNGQLKQNEVINVLQKQETLQHQLQEEIDRQRMAAIASHLEIKEQATRNRLQELKRRLNQSSSKDEYSRQQNVESSPNSVFRRPGSSSSPAAAIDPRLASQSAGTGKPGSYSHLQFLEAQRLAAYQQNNNQIKFQSKFQKSAPQQKNIFRIQAQGAASKSRGQNQQRTRDSKFQQSSQPRTAQRKDSYDKYARQASSDLLRMKLQTFIKSQANSKRQEMIAKEAAKRIQPVMEEPEFHKKGIIASPKNYYYLQKKESSAVNVPKGILKNKQAIEIT